LFPEKSGQRQKHPVWLNSRPFFSGRDEFYSRSRERVANVLFRIRMEILLHWRASRPALGEPRQTQDADLTLITGFGNEELFVDQLLATF